MSSFHLRQPFKLYEIGALIFSYVLAIVIRQGTDWTPEQLVEVTKSTHSNSNIHKTIGFGHVVTVKHPLPNIETISKAPQVVLGLSSGVAWMMVSGQIT